MILRGLAVIIILAGLMGPASAQERVTVGTQRLVTNGALFIAAAQGYFKAEGLDLEMTAYPSEQAVVDALAVGTTDFGVAGFTRTAFSLAGKGAIKAIAAQVSEKRDYEGNEIIASNAAYARGLRKPEDIAGKSVAISEISSPFHYQLGQIARIKQFDLGTITLKPLQTLDAMSRAVGVGQVDAAILPLQHAREIIALGQAKLVGWYSDLDEQQLGALFTYTKMIETRRATVEKFVRAYKRGAAEYADALLRQDRSAKRISDAKSHVAAAMIARYVYPGRATEAAIAVVEAGVYYMDSQARLDAADIERQVEWYKALGLVDKSVDARAVMDLSFTK